MKKLTTTKFSELDKLVRNDFYVKAKPQDRLMFSYGHPRMAEYMKLLRFRDKDKLKIRLGTKASSKSAHSKKQGFIAVNPISSTNAFYQEVRIKRINAVFADFHQPFNRIKSYRTFKKKILTKTKNRHSQVRVCRFN